MNRMEPTTVWLGNGQEPITVAGPLVQPNGKPDPEDWARYHRDLQAARRRSELSTRRDEHPTAQWQRQMMTQHPDICWCMVSPTRACVRTLPCPDHTR